MIHLKKEGGLVFFQKGLKNDSIVKNKSDLFYLYVPDSLRKSISIHTLNGQFQALGSDTTLKFIHVQDIQYESIFVQAENKGGYTFKTLINGPSSLNSSEVRIRIFDKRTGNLILENTFFYKPQ